MDHGLVVASGTPDYVFRRADQPRLQTFLANYVERNVFWAAGA